MHLSKCGKSEDFAGTLNQVPSKATLNSRNCSTEDFQASYARRVGIFSIAQWDDGDLSADVQKMQFLAIDCTERFVGELCTESCLSETTGCCQSNEVR